jgi:hypothetical protein
MHHAKPDQSGVGPFDQIVDGHSEKQGTEQVASRFNEKQEIGESQPVSVLQDQLAQGGKA